MAQARPQLTVAALVFGMRGAQVVAVAVRMGVADTIGDAERSAAEVAAAYGTPEQPMFRLLRAMTALGLCEENGPDRFVLSDAGQLLRKDHPASMATFADMYLTIWDDLEASVRTGEPAFDRAYGMPFFTHLSHDHELSTLFNTSIGLTTQRVATHLPAAYDFGRFGTVTDVGGGSGTLLTAILAAHPHLHGVVFDSPSGAAEAAATVAARGMADRCTVETGDFFTAVPPGADAYLLKSIVHDWDDARAATILRHCAAGLAEGGRVLVVEPLVPDLAAEGGPRPYLDDLNMLVTLGGRERTRGDFERLCATAGLRVVAVTDLPAEVGFSVVEAVPA